MMEKKDREKNKKYRVTIFRDWYRKEKILN
jgi:hypothetical protein